MYPYVLSNEQLIGMHGNNERVKITELGLGVRRVYRVLVEVAQ